MAHMEKETPGRSMPPAAAHDITNGNDMNIKLPVKLWIPLNRWFNSKYNPITPVINSILSRMKIALMDIYPALKKSDVKNGITGGR